MLDNQALIPLVGSDSVLDLNALVNASGSLMFLSQTLMNNLNTKGNAREKVNIQIVLHKTDNITSNGQPYLYKDLPNKLKYGCQ